MSKLIDEDLRPVERTEKRKAGAKIPPSQKVIVSIKAHALTPAVIAMLEDIAESISPTATSSDVVAEVLMTASESELRDIIARRHEAIVERLKGT